MEVWEGVDTWDSEVNWKFRVDLFISYYPLYTSHALSVPLFPSQIPTPIPRATTRHTTPKHHTSWANFPHPHARALSPFAFNFIFEANFNDFLGFFTLFKPKISSFLHLNAKIERKIIGGEVQF